LAPTEAKPFANAEPEAVLYGKLWHTDYKTPWYKYYTTKWYQCWYDDSLSLALKYGYAKSKQLQGVGMWALGYDGNRSELWDALTDAFISDNRIERTASERLSFSLQPNHPNPANPGTTFNIKLAPSSAYPPLKLTIYTLQGRPIFRTLVVPENKSSLQYLWSGRTWEGTLPPSGVYLYTVSGSNISKRGKFILLR